MKAFNQIPLLILSLFLFVQEGKATHIVGGEITYRNLSNYNYEITLKLYRDCHNGTAYFDKPTYITVFNSAGQVLGQIQMPLPDTTILPIVLTNPCLQPPTNVCVQQGIFIDTIYLPPIPGGYQ
ncbi:MAG TPA: hypothetical protein VNW99_09895, partial [Cytophagaceae bacterium]|nr:hypothetical protein [Cytophagaceae bacterium]